MYSSEVSSYQVDLREAFEDVMVDAGVDMYLAGHIHCKLAQYAAHLHILQVTSHEDDKDKG